MSRVSAAHSTYLHTRKEHDPVPNRWQQVKVDAGLDIVIIASCLLQIQDLLALGFKGAVW